MDSGLIQLACSYVLHENNEEVGSPFLKIENLSSGKDDGLNPMIMCLICFVLAEAPMLPACSFVQDQIFARGALRKQKSSWPRSELYGSRSKAYMEDSHRTQASIMNFKFIRGLLMRG
uniref:Uncharacterized protein n=1 Tax=Sphaerodactylus townsendi TaxID=933632 RepID=A0ACB8EN52_9SAUR